MSSSSASIATAAAFAVPLGTSPPLRLRRPAAAPRSCRHTVLPWQISCAHRSRETRNSATAPPRRPPPPPAALLAHITTLNARARGVKCPFWRRRFTDALEATRDVLVWALRTRHKSLPLPPLDQLPLVLSGDMVPRPSSPTAAPAPAAKTTSPLKRRGLSVGERLAIIRDDFLVRQYYVTGRLSSSIYRDDCLFDGPDPDGRVRGTRKFCDAASGLFDARSSRVDLIDVYVQKTSSPAAVAPAASGGRVTGGENRTNARGDDCDGCVIVAEWRLEGVLKLPWRPAIKPYVGATTYRFDTDGLVREHVETWSVGVIDAFLSVVVKGFGVAPAPEASDLRLEKLRDGSLQWSDGVDERTGERNME